MTYRLGKTEARKGAVSFLFTDYFDAKKLPTPPATFGHYDQVPNYFMLANDQYGDCVWAGAAHEHMIWSLEGGRPRAKFWTKNVLSDYAAVTGFDISKTDAKGDNPTDQGTDMSEAAAYRKKTGVLTADGSRRRIDGYLSLEVGNWDQLVLATWLFKAAGVGLQLPKQAPDWFDEDKPWAIPWYRPFWKPRILGGHYAPAVGRIPNGNMPVVTWGGVLTAGMSQGFYERFSDEALAYLDLEVLNQKGLSPEGYDEDELRKHFGRLA